MTNPQDFDQIIANLTAGKITDDMRDFALGRRTAGSDRVSAAVKEAARRPTDHAARERMLAKRAARRANA